MKENTILTVISESAHHVYVYLSKSGLGSIFSVVTSDRAGTSDRPKTRIAMTRSGTVEAKITLLLRIIR